MSVATLSAYPSSSHNFNFLTPTDQTDHAEESSPQMQHHSSPDADLNAISIPSTTISTPSEVVPPAALVPSLLYLSFNQDHGCFAAGTEHGLRIYNCDPFSEIFRRDFDLGGGIGIVEMLFRCNILALVGSGPEPQYPPNKVMIWDDHQSHCIGELWFRSEVRSVQLRRDRIVVVLEQKIFVYNFADLKKLHRIETFANPKDSAQCLRGLGLWFWFVPDCKKGRLGRSITSRRGLSSLWLMIQELPALHSRRTGSCLLPPAQKELWFAFIILLTVACCKSFHKIRVRRGADRAEIYSLAFSSNAKWLPVSSDKGTIHVFSLKVNAGSLGIDRSRGAASDLVTPPQFSLSFIRGVLPKYFSSEWSVAQFRLLEGSQYIVAFGYEKNTVIILGMDGS